MKALRFNTGKPQLSYFSRSFPSAVEGVARVMEFGATKYADGNWKLGGKPDTEYLDSSARHMASFLEGETYDKDSGCHHVAHCIWNMCALLELNHSEDPLIDEALFRSQMAHWAEEKEKKREGPDITAEREARQLGLKFSPVKAISQEDVNEVLKELRRAVRTEETPMPECMKEKGCPYPEGKKPEFIEMPDHTDLGGFAPCDPAAFGVDKPRETDWVDDLNNWIIEHRKEPAKDEVPMVKLLPLPPMPETWDEAVVRLRREQAPPKDIKFVLKDGERSESFQSLVSDYIHPALQKDALRRAREAFFSRFDKQGFYADGEVV